jgi:hypothetical protein
MGRAGLMAKLRFTLGQTMNTKTLLTATLIAVATSALCAGSADALVFCEMGGPPCGPDAIPEPSTWAMMLVGFFGLGGLLRRRRPKAALQVD